MRRSRGSSRPSARLLAAAGAAVVVLALAGCASPTDAGGTGDVPRDDPSPPPSTPTTAPSEAPSEATDVLPDATAMDLAPGSAGRGLPDGVGWPVDAPAGAAWSPAEGLLFVVTAGSSGCPVLPEPEAAGDATAVTVTLVPPSGDRMCTADWAATTSVVAVPDGADAGAPLAVTLGEHGTVEVPPRAAAGTAGPAAWVPAG
jgi:hypothetical protein